MPRNDFKVENRTLHTRKCPVFAHSQRIPLVLFCYSGGALRPSTTYIIFPLLNATQYL